MWLSAVEVALAGGILSLDRFSLQIMISRPIIVGPLIGLILQAPFSGLVMGMLIELIWIDRFFMGSYIPPHDSLTTILATAGSILAGKEIGSISCELQVLSLLVFFPCATLGQMLDRKIFASNDILSQRVMEYARAGNARGITFSHYKALFKTYVATILLIFLLLVPGVLLLIWFYPLLSEKGVQALRYIFYFIPLLGIAVALNTIKMRGTIPIFSGVFLILVLVGKIFVS